MRLFTLILGLLAISLSVGCHRNETDMPQTSTQLSTAHSSVAIDGTSIGDVSNAPVGAVSNIEIVQKDVRTVINAVYGGDVETVLSFTHPQIIELMGGMTQARSLLKTTLSKFKSAGMSVESFDFPEDPTFLETELHHFVIVPTKIIVKAHGQRAESLNYQFGVKSVGTTQWTYIEGSRINKQNVSTLFPDFPSNYEFPEFYRKKL